jgi:hypothetical protein
VQYERYVDLQAALRTLDGAGKTVQFVFPIPFAQKAAIISHD